MIDELRHACASSEGYLDRLVEAVVVERKGQERTWWREGKGEGGGRLKKELLKVVDRARQGGQLPGTVFDPGSTTRSRPNPHFLLDIFQTFESLTCP